jgi:hypothetical protein
MRKCVWVALAGILWGCGQGNLGGGGIEVPNGLSRDGDRLHGRGPPRRQGAPSGQGIVDRTRRFRPCPWRLDSALDGRPREGGLPSSLRRRGLGGGDLRRFGHEIASRQRPPGLPGTDAAVHLEGNLGTGPISGVRIRLGGSDRTTVTDANGAFQFDSLPQGTWNLVAQPGKALAALKTVDLGLDPLSAQGLADDTNSVLLDDFSDGTNVWNLQGLFGDGYWWIQAAAATEQVFGVSGAWNAVTGDGTSHWISIPVNLAGVANPWADAGLDLGTANGVLPELSNLQSVRIKYRGNGTWTFAMVEQLSDTTRAWTANLALDTAWTTVDIPAGSLSSPGQTWNSAPRHVRQMLFQTSSSGKLEIAQVSLEGASISNWSR